MSFCVCMRATCTCFGRTIVNPNCYLAVSIITIINHYLWKLCGNALGWKSVFFLTNILYIALRKGFIMMWSCVTMTCRRDWVQHEWQPLDTCAGSKNNVHPCDRNHLKMPIWTLNYLSITLPCPQKLIFLANVSGCKKSISTVRRVERDRMRENIGMRRKNNSVGEKILPIL